jgi:putative addiction module component (TIGR02574 family)
MAIEKILQEALALPPEERGALVSALLETLEPEGDVTEQEWEAAWSAELERRARDLDEGRVTPIPLDEAMRQLRARIATKR